MCERETEREKQTVVLVTVIVRKTARCQCVAFCHAACRGLSVRTADFFFFGSRK